MKELQERFKDELGKTFGDWDQNGARFGNSSYGDIADKLCMSGSQFSKLLYGSATNGMYERSIKNISQLRKLKRLEDDYSELNEKFLESSKRKSPKFIYLLIGVPILLLFGYGIGTFLNQKPPEVVPEDNHNIHALSPFFDRKFNDVHASPFLSIDEAQEYCPGSAFEGVWSLDKPYIIPLPLKRPGLYFIAKEVDMRVKCSRNVEPDQKGKLLLGFENLVHELWIDSKREPFAPKYFNVASKNYTKEFYNIDFENDSSFKKVATIKSFFFNTFELDGDLILRKGEPMGRYAESVNHELANQYKIDVKYVLQEIIGNLVKTKCASAQNNYCNPNTMVENESTIKFDCDFTINNENVGLGGSYPYAKTYRLIKQNYLDNLLCKCQ